jgi:hypothetical protein
MELVDQIYLVPPPNPQVELDFLLCFNATCQNQIEKRKGEENMG